MGQVTQSLLTSGGNTTNTSFNTASVSPTNGKVILVAVHSRDNSAPYSVPTLSGLGMTWTQVATVTTVTVGLNTMTLFRGVANGNTGAITINFATTQSRIGWGVIELGNVDTGGTNGSNAIVQSATSSNNAGSGSVGPTLSAFSDSNNATLATFIMNGTNPSWTPEGGYTELYDFTTASFCRSMAEFIVSNDTTPRATMVMDEGTQEYAAIAVELKYMEEAQGNFFELF